LVLPDDPSATFFDEDPASEDPKKDFFEIEKITQPIL